MTNTDEDDIKIILLGQSGVGKTNLINVFIGKQFDTSTETTSTSYCFEGEYNFNNKPYRYNIWDTAGQEKYRAINKMFIRGSKIILIVYSILYLSTLYALYHNESYTKQWALADISKIPSHSVPLLLLLEKEINEHEQQNP